MARAPILNISVRLLTFIILESDMQIIFGYSRSNNVIVKKQDSGFKMALDHTIRQICKTAIS
jgi:hypothetical protein